MAINGFQKEFRQKLQALMGVDQADKQAQMPNPRNYILNFEQVQTMAESMGFAKKSRPESEMQEMNDLYIMFKCNQDQSILAENL